MAGAYLTNKNQANLTKKIIYVGKISLLNKKIIKMNLIKRLIRLRAFIILRNGAILIVIVIEICRLIGIDRIDLMWSWVKFAWKWMTTANFNTILAIVGIGFAFYGWTQSIKADQTLKEIQTATKNLEDDIDKIQETEQSMKIALTRLESSIINLEDATRRNLQGFAEIFARALWLLDKSEEEIWYVNFLFGFGRPHRYNPKILDEYTPLANTLKITQTNFQDAVSEFSESLVKKIQSIPKFYAIVLNENSLNNLFIARLKDKTGYREIEDNLQAELDYEKNLYKRIYSASNSRKEEIKKDFQVCEQNRLPFQMLITQIRKGTEQNERKWGCLVFLVGTENVEPDSPNKEPKGFYTELDHVVDVYKEVASSLKQSGIPFDWETFK